MGKGNQMIRGLDGATVRTFFIDVAESFESAEKRMIVEHREDLADEISGLSFAMRRRKVEQMMMDGRLPINMSDQYVNQRISDDANDELHNIMYEIAGIDGIPGFQKVWPWRAESDLVSGYRDVGNVIAESDHCIVVIADNESDVAIGCVNADTYENILENVIADNPGLRTESSQNDAAAKKWTESQEAYLSDANAVMRKVHEYFGDQKNALSVRTGPWTSSPMPSVEEMDKNGSRYYF